jgi:hypothetical protein
MSRPRDVALEQLALVSIIGSCRPEKGQVFPIEVAIGTVAPEKQLETWLVRPETEWATWWGWDREAAARSGVKLGLLWRAGRPRQEVAACLSDRIAGRTLLSLTAKSDASLLGLVLDDEARLPVIDPEEFVADHVGSHRTRLLLAQARNISRPLLSYRHRALASVLIGVTALEWLIQAEESGEVGGL